MGAVDQVLGEVDNAGADAADIDLDRFVAPHLRQCQVVGTGHEDGVPAAEVGTHHAARLAGVGLEDAFASGAARIVDGDQIAVALVDDKELVVSGVVVQTVGVGAFLLYCAADLDARLGDAGHC